VRQVANGLVRGPPPQLARGGDMRALTDTTALRDALICLRAGTYALGRTVSIMRAAGGETASNTGGGLGPLPRVKVGAPVHISQRPLPARTRLRATFILVLGVLTFNVSTCVTPRPSFCPNRSAAGREQKREHAIGQKQ
jgi:hypothetical protein